MVTNQAKLTETQLLKFLFFISQFVTIQETKISREKL